MDGKEVPETFQASYLIGADGGKGMFSQLILRRGLILCVISVGICRKLLGLTFLGETRDEMNSEVVGDICMEVDGINTATSATSHVSTTTMTLLATM